MSSPAPTPPDDPAPARAGELPAEETAGTKPAAAEQAPRQPWPIKWIVFAILAYIFVSMVFQYFMG